MTDRHYTVQMIPPRRRTHERRPPVIEYATVTDEGHGLTATVYAGSVRDAIRAATVAILGEDAPDWTGATSDPADDIDCYDWRVEQWPPVTEYIISAQPGASPFARCTTWREARQAATKAAYRAGTGWRPRIVAYCDDGQPRYL